MSAFVIIEGDVFQLDDQGNPIAPDAGAAATALPATQGGVLGAGKRASDGKPALIRTDDDGRQTVTADALPLPTGAATEAKQDTGNTSLGSMDGKLTTIIGHVDGLEGKLDTGNASLGSIDTKVSTAAKQDTGNASLSSIDGKVATETTASSINTVVTAIRDTAGVKKITDPLPAGSNEIGAVKQGTKAALADAWPTVPTDSAGNAIGSVLDNSIRRLEARSTIVGQASTGGAEAKVTTIVDPEDAAERRLQTEARLAPGSQVNIATGIPSDPADLVIGQCLNIGSPNLLVDGSGTAVDFDFGPSTGIESVQELRLVFAADDFDFDGAKFGPNALLANGVKIQTVLNSVVTDIFTIIQNEDFLRVPGRTPLVNNTGPKDVLVASFGFSGLLKLDAATSDVIRIKVQDNLTSIKLKYFTGTVLGAKD